MTVGFVMLVHTALDRAEQVARHWAKADCPVVIHVDKKVKRQDHAAFVNALGDVDIRTNMTARGSLSLPGEWKFSYSANFDVVTGEFTNQFWRLSRPLHCWRLEFNRGLADGSDFGISLYLEDIRDLRLDRGDRARQAGFSNGLPAF